jgi:hypothetical protein
MQRGVPSAPNRTHGLRLRWATEGTQVEDRTTGEPLATLKTAWVGRAEDGALAPAEAVLSGHEVTRRWGAVTEWWRNDEAGVEQGWTVEARPDGAGPLRVEVEVEGAAVRGEGEGLRLETKTGRLLAYGGLKAWDARGRGLETRLLPERDGWRMEVDDEGAEYPVTVDPLLTAAAWTAESNQAGASFGSSVASAGDVNGDGFSDVVVGARNFDNGEADEGRAFVYLGSATGLATTPAWMAESNQTNALFGTSVAGAGDVNGDGFSDVVVGAPNFDNSETDEGRAASTTARRMKGGPSSTWAARRASRRRPRGRRSPTRPSLTSAPA